MIALRRPVVAALVLAASVVAKSEHVAVDRSTQDDRTLQVMTMKSAVVEEDGMKALDELGQNSAGIASSMILAFLKKDGFTDKEKKCFVEGSRTFDRNIMQVSEQIGQLVEHMVSIAGMSDPLMARRLHQRGSTPPPPEDADLLGAMGMLGAGPLQVMMEVGTGVAAIVEEVGSSLQLLEKLSKHIAHKCLDATAMEELDEAGSHARDIKFEAGHFLANGADVLTELEAGAVAFKNNDFEGFGASIGTALRKLLLSKATVGFSLEGDQGEYMMMNLTTGFLEGFFGKGFTIEVTSDGDPKRPMHIDIKKCIKANMPLFEQLGSMAFLVYKEATKEDGLLDHTKHKGNKEKEEDDEGGLGSGLFTFAMQLPEAMQRCGIDEKHQGMLTASVLALGAGMHVSLQTPNKKASASEASGNMDQAIQDWKKLDWHAFGLDLGAWLQDMVMNMFPEKYAVGDAGLMQQLSALRGHDRHLGNGGSLDRFLVWGLASVTGLAVGGVAARWAQAAQHQLLECDGDGDQSLE